MNVTNFIPMDPNNLASSSSRTLNSQFANMYHFFQSDPRYSQFPIDYGIFQAYQPSHVYSMPEPFVHNPLINHSVLRFPPSVAGFPQAPLWQGAIPSTSLEDNVSRVSKTESISPMNETSTVTPSQSNSTNTSVNREKNLTKRKKKSKRTIQDHIPKKDWKKEDADLALKTELKFGIAKKRQQIIIRFPDEDLSADIVKEFHQGIKFVHFQTSCGPRYCFAQIEENVNIDSVIQTLNEIKFQNGYLKAERKLHKEEDLIRAEEIDPYTLYLGNLPQNVTSHSVKGKFKKASRIDIGFAQKIKFTRYAFIRFKSVHDAIEAYKENLAMVIDNRSVVLRFRRINIKETDPTKTKKIKTEGDFVEIENNEYPGEIQNKASEKEKNLQAPLPPPIIKTEKSKGYSDEIENETSSLTPYFVPLLGRNNDDSIAKNLNFVEENNGTPSSENLLKFTNESETPLTKFISHVTGVPRISVNDAELFKTVILKLADIFENRRFLNV